jgi:hypothetical protein
MLICLVLPYSKRRLERSTVPGTVQPRTHGISRTKKDVLGRLFLIIWWSRGDLNPRPPVLRCRYYMRSRVY